MNKFLKVVEAKMAESTAWPIIVSVVCTVVGWALGQVAHIISTALVR